MAMLRRNLLSLIGFLCLAIALCQAIEDHNKFSNLHQDTLGYVLSPGLEAALQLDDITWHWIPWRRVRSELRDGVLYEQNCSVPESNFPEDLFTDEQLRQGAIVLHFIAVIYGFTVLAVICNDYFIPTVECICDDFSLSKDVAAATFMASATSCPELFANIMGTFVTESDLGVGTIVGSALFNTLGVSAIGGLAAIHPMQLEAWPITRDCAIYVMNVLVLLAIVWDSTVMWYEALVLVILYLVYFTSMLNNERIVSCFRRICNSDTNNDEVGIENAAYEEPTKDTLDPNVQIEIPDEEKPEKIRKSLWRFPSEKTISLKIWYLYTWPIKFIFTCTIPSPKTFRKLYPLTFFICIIWIGIDSYFVSWMITTIGDTFVVPDSIMGMTLSAFGGCLPEAATIFIMSRRGDGGMGVSNTMGSSTLAILFSLGIPWFAKTMSLINTENGGKIELDSSGIAYVVGMIIVAVILLYIILHFGKHMLRKSTGTIMILSYLVVVTIAILIESGVFFEVQPDVCV